MARSKAAVSSAWPLLLAAVAIGCSSAEIVAEKTKDCKGPTPYEIGTSIPGRTGQGDCLGFDKSAGQLYTFRLTEPKAISVNVVTNDFPGYVGIFSPANNDIASMNSDFQGSNLKVRAMLPAGTFTIFVASMTNRNGSYTLRSAPDSLTGCWDGNSLGVLRGVTVPGRITREDCASSTSPTWYDTYQLFLSAGEQVTIQLTASQLTGLEVKTERRGLVLQRVVQPNGTITATLTAAAAERFYIGVVAYLNGNLPLRLPYDYTMRLD